MRIGEYRVRLQPNNATAPAGLGLVLQRKGRTRPSGYRHYGFKRGRWPLWEPLAPPCERGNGTAVGSGRIRLQPENTDAHYNLGLALEGQRGFQQGVSGGIPRG